MALSEDVGKKARVKPFLVPRSRESLKWAVCELRPCPNSDVHMVQCQKGIKLKIVYP